MMLETQGATEIVTLPQFTALNTFASICIHPQQVPQGVPVIFQGTPDQSSVVQGH